jgi:hypothetical protein
MPIVIIIVKVIKITKTGNIPPLKNTHAHFPSLKQEKLKKKRQIQQQQRKKENNNNNRKNMHDYT